MKILITRPIQQAAQLAQTLAKHNIASICFPVLEILSPLDRGALLHTVKAMARVELLIFISPTAVHALFAAFPTLVLSHQTVLAMGRGTAQALAEYTNQSALYPQPQTSAGLLALPELQQVQGQQIIIFAGEDGNTQIADTLSERGAIVQMAYTHRRSLPHYDSITWNAEEITLSLCTSGQSLANFRTLIDQLKLTVLLDKPLLVITPAMQQQARQLGFKSAIIQAEGASDQQLLTALQDFQQRMPHD